MREPSPHAPVSEEAEAPVGWEVGEHRVPDDKFEGAPVFVLTPGKVGTMAMVQTIAQNNPGRLVVHSHSFTESALATRRRTLRMLGETDEAIEKKMRWDYEIHRRLLDNRTSQIQGKDPVPSSDKIIVVTIVRDPVARLVSEQFQNSPDAALLDAADVFGLPVLARFIEDRIHRTADHIIDRTGQWYADLGWASGFDINETFLPVRDGHAIIETDLVRLLFLKLEQLDDMAGPGLNALSLKAGPLLRANSASDRAAASEIGKLKAALRVSDAVLDACYARPWVRHSYNEQEIAAMRAKWATPEGNVEARGRIDGKAINGTIGKYLARVTALERSKRQAEEYAAKIAQLQRALAAAGEASERQRLAHEQQTAKLNQKLAQAEQREAASERQRLAYEQLADKLNQKLAQAEQREAALSERLEAFRELADKQEDKIKALRKGE
jgi:hypothetical protein